MKITKIVNFPAGPANKNHTVALEDTKVSKPLRSGTIQTPAADPSSTPQTLRTNMQWLRSIQNSFVGLSDRKFEDAASRLGDLEGKSIGPEQNGTPEENGALAGMFGSAVTLPTHTFEAPELPSDGGAAPRHNQAAGLADGTTTTNEGTDETDSNGGQHITESNTTENSDGSTDTDVQTHDSDGQGNSTETQSVEHTNADGTSYGERTTTTTNADGSTETTHESWGNAPDSSSSSGSTHEAHEGQAGHESSGTGSSTGSGSAGSDSSSVSTGGRSHENSTGTGSGRSTGNHYPFPSGLTNPARVTDQLEPTAPVDVPYQVPGKTVAFGPLKPHDRESNPNPDAEQHGEFSGAKPSTNGLTMPATEFSTQTQSTRPIVDRNFGRIDPTPDKP